MESVIHAKSGCFLLSLLIHQVIWLQIQKSYMFVLKDMT